jgi:hypothetical protein
VSVYERRGVDCPEPRRRGYLPVRREAGVGFHVSDDDLFTLSRRPTAGGALVIDGGEVLEELVAKACLRRDSERTANGIDDLHAATVRVQQRKGVFEALVEHCPRVG